MNSITLHPNATLVLAFDNEPNRNALRARLASSLPPEVLGKLKAGNVEGQFTLTVRVQDITHPLVIPLGGGQANKAPTPIPSLGTPTFERLKSMPRENVPGVNAEAHTEEKPTTSGVVTNMGVPGAINNDPATATNAGIEGSPGQAIQSAIGNGPGTPTPGGFAGPDKAAKVGGGAAGVFAAPDAGKAHPDGQEQDAGAVNVSKAAIQEEKDAAKNVADEKENQGKAEEKQLV